MSHMAVKARTRITATQSYKRAHLHRETESAVLAQVVLHIADLELRAVPLQLAEQGARRLPQQVAQHLRHIRFNQGTNVALSTVSYEICNPTIFVV